MVIRDRHPLQKLPISAVIPVLKLCDCREDDVDNLIFKRSVTQTIIE